MTLNRCLLGPDNKGQVGDTVSLDEYINTLKTDKESVGPLQYGGEVELVALQAMLNQPIVVIEQRHGHDACISIYGEIEIEAAESEAADKKEQQPIFLHRTGSRRPCTLRCVLPTRGSELDGSTG